MEFIKNLLGLRNQIGGFMNGQAVIELESGEHGIIVETSPTIFKMRGINGNLYVKEPKFFKIDYSDQDYHNRIRWKVGDDYKNKFTGNKGRIIESIEQFVWMCVENTKFVCLNEVEMIRVDRNVFITNFRGDAEDLKSQGNTEIDFIKEILSSYILRCARRIVQNNLINEEQLSRVAKECTKKISERVYENISDIEPIRILYERFESIINMLEHWNLFKWDEFREQFKIKIVARGGDDFSIIQFFFYCIGVLFDRIMYIKTISKNCDQANSTYSSGQLTDTNQGMSRVKPISEIQSERRSRLNESANAALSSAAVRDIIVAAGIQGVTDRFICSDLKLYNIPESEKVRFETITVSSENLGVPIMQAPAIYWEMIGKYVITDLESLLLFRFDSSGKSAYQDTFFSKYDIEVSGCFKEGKPCICIRGGPKILAFAEWVIANRTRQEQKLRRKFQNVRTLNIEVLEFYILFQTRYSLGNICFVILGLYEELMDLMEQTQFKELVELSYTDECVRLDNLEKEHVQRVHSVLPQRVQQRLRTTVLPRLSTLLEESPASSSSSAFSSASALLESASKRGQLRQESRQQPRPGSRESFLMESKLASLLSSSSTQSRGQEQRRQELSHLSQYSVPPQGRLVPTNPCEKLTGSEASNCNTRLKQSHLDRLAMRK